MDINVRTIEDEDATPEFLQYSNIRANAMMLAARLAKQGRQELGERLRDWVFLMPAYVGPRTKDEANG